MPDADPQPQEWSLLFDHLCIERGHTDSGSLASAYCAHTKRKTASNYDSALRNINNWRRGQHLPSQRNFRILSQILAVQVGDERWESWSGLYEKAQRRKREVGATEVIDASPDIVPAQAVVSSVRRSFRWHIIAAVALAVLVASGVIMLTATWKQSTEAKGPDSGSDAINIAGQYFFSRDRVNAKLGESIIVHGHRGACGEQPPSWEDTSSKLPKLTIGIWSDGGVGVRNSDACRGPTPARAVVFTATKQGEGRVSLFGDNLLISVSE